MARGCPGSRRLSTHLPLPIEVYSRARPAASSSGPLHRPISQDRRHRGHLPRLPAAVPVPVRVRVRARRARHAAFVEVPGDAGHTVPGQRGRIIAEFFDVGYFREIAWNERPEAARLLAAITDPVRGFDAIVVGEYARAFHGSQAVCLVPLLREHDVQLWLPEVDGPVDLDSPMHQALLLMLGAQAK
jgi:hypothetical protein